MSEDQLLVEAPSAGVAFLLIVRQAFTQPMIVILYSIFVVSAAFHAYNGLWTALITWGVLTTNRIQKIVRKFTYALMIIVTFFGLSAAWGSYLL